MCLIDYSQKKNMFESLSPLMTSNMFDDSLPVCISFYTPFLDNETKSIPAEYVDVIIELVLFIVIMRHFHDIVPLSDDVLDMDKTDEDYLDDSERIEINTVISWIVDEEIHTLIDNGYEFSPEELQTKMVDLTEYYEEKVDVLITKLFDDLVYDPLEPTDVTLDILYACAEKHQRIMIKQLKFYPDIHKLWILLVG